MKQCLVCGKEVSELEVRGRPNVVCSEACRHTRKNTQREESRQRAAQRGCPPDLHGTCAGYTQYKCSCDLCRRWMRDYQKGRRSKIKAGNAVS